ncbi:hypothetical protein P7K49_001721 [Saguinus oedipus]|uniref:Major facilitator superfamily (MFS) profile domain-containing protein n=1 Tax=Saguinus oedipus TaxID=9490 RepID=A0ABQ9WFB0_SAGOE|nr:hypothetical protein P7K49_001721 [Saguinus oedipus]
MKGGSQRTSPSASRRPLAAKGPCGPHSPGPFRFRRRSRQIGTLRRPSRFWSRLAAGELRGTRARTRPCPPAPPRRLHSPSTLSPQRAPWPPRLPCLLRRCPGPTQLRLRARLQLPGHPKLAARRAPGPTPGRRSRLLVRGEAPSSLLQPRDPASSPQDEHRAPPPSTPLLRTSVEPLCPQPLPKRWASGPFPAHPSPRDGRWAPSPLPGVAHFPLSPRGWAEGEDFGASSSAAARPQAVVTLGAAAGGVLGGWLVDRAGRKLSLLLCSVPFVTGFAVITAAQDVWMLLGGRLLTGLACGIASLVAPVYISEIAYPAVRGLLGSCVQLMVVIGILLAYLAGWVLEWRWLAVLGCVPPSLMLLLMCFMPETPRFLLTQHRRQEAMAALQFLWGSEQGWEEPPTGAEQGFHLALLWQPGIYKPFVIGVSLMAFQQLSGVNAIMFYAETIFEEAKFKDSSLASIIVGVIQVLFTAVAALIMDRAGRRLLLALSGEGLTLCRMGALGQSPRHGLEGLCQGHHIAGGGQGAFVMTNIVD